MNPQYNSGYGGGYPQGNAPQYDSYDQQGGGSAASYYSGGQQQQQHHQQQQYGEEYPPQNQQHGYGQQQEYGGQPPQYGQQQQHQGGNRDEQFPGQQQPGQEGADGERGFLGALGGGVAGAWGGHKLGGRSGHGTLSAVLGAVAGAVAGSKLQDGVSDWRHERHDEKEREEEERRRREEEQRRYDQQQFHHGGHHGGPPPPPFGGGPPREMSRGFDGGSYGGGGGGGNFSASSEDIRLEPYGEYMLHASCRRADGSYQSSSISLNRILENDQGRFRWSSSSGRGAGGPGSVTVQPGDTLRDIAARHGVGFEEIARHNGIQNPDMIYPGQVLQVPNGGGYGGYGGGGGGNFGASARDVRLVDGGRVLEGELLRDGGWERSHIRLDERIGNENGTLEFV